MSMDVNKFGQFQAAKIKPRKPEPKPDEGTKPTGRAGDTKAVQLPDGKIADMIDNAKNQVGEAKTASSDVKAGKEPQVNYIDLENYNNEPKGFKVADKQQVGNRTIYVEWEIVDIYTNEQGVEVREWVSRTITEDDYNNNPNKA